MLESVDITTDVMIDSRDISVVVQGPVVPNVTAQCLQSIRTYLPHAEIILSTWQGSDVSGLAYDHLQLNADPGGFRQADGQLNNIVRQLVSTQAGLARATRQYAVKLRTDFVLTGQAFLKHFSQHCQRDARAFCKYPLFSSKLLVLTMFIRSPLVCGRGYLFHMSDLFVFGKRADVWDLFDIPYPARDDDYFNYFPEQYIWTAFLRKKGIDVHLIRGEQKNFFKYCFSEQTLVDNFYCIEPEVSALQLPERFFASARHTNYSQQEWDWLCAKYSHPSLGAMHRFTLPLGRWWNDKRQRRLKKIRWQLGRVREYFGKGAG